MDSTETKHPDAAPATSLTPADIALIEGIVRRVLAEQDHDCRFDLTAESARNLEHMGEMVTGLQQGATSGLDVMRDNHLWIATARKRADKVSAAFVGVVATSLALGLLAATWQGLKAMLAGAAP